MSCFATPPLTFPLLALSKTPIKVHSSKSIQANGPDLFENKQRVSGDKQFNFCIKFNLLGKIFAKY